MNNINLKKIFKSILVTGLVGGFVIGVTSAFFSDTETSAGNTLQAGTLDLKIDNTSYYNGLLNTETSWTLDDLTDQLFFDFADIKPNDYGEDTISLHAENDYWACMQVDVTENDDETCTEPELLDDPNCVPNDGNLNDGELGGLLEFLWWADDGDNVLEDNEEVFKTGNASTLFAQDNVWTLADSQSSIFPTPGPLPATETTYVGKAWCFGTIAAAPLVDADRDGPHENNDETGQTGTPEDGGFTCDGTAVNNASQTDSLLGDITFTAYQARNNDNFTCATPSITPTLSVTPTPVACVPGFATGVASSAQGTRKNGTAVLAERSDTNDALGAPQSTGVPVDNPTVAGSFFSLGFGPNNTPGGNIVLTFANPIVDLAGFDFRVFEVTGATTPPYPDEKIMVEASQDGTTWQTVTLSVARDAFLDLGVTTLDWASHVRITDVSDKSLSGFETIADAYDLDGVQTFCGTQPN